MSSVTPKTQEQNDLKILNDEFQEVYDHVEPTRAAIRGFNRNLIVYEQGQRQKGNPTRPSH